MLINLVTTSFTSIVKVYKYASDASSRDSKEFSNKRKCIDIERGKCSKHNSNSVLTTPPKRDTLTIKHISPGFYVCAEEYLIPGMHSYGRTVYAMDCIEKMIWEHSLLHMTNAVPLVGEWVGDNITYRRLTELECPLFSMLYQVR